MNKKGIVLMLGVSLMMATGAAMLAKTWMQEQNGEGDDESNMAKVVVAALQIPFGETVQASDLRMLELPPNAVPAGSFSDIESVAGRVSNQVIYPGEIVLEGRVAEHLGGSALAAVLEHGKRAMSVRVDDVVGVAGFLLPGNRVDVVSAKRNGDNRNVASETILRNIKVLAVDQIASQERDGPVIVRAVTVEVDPRQAEKLVEATQEGKVQLTLRNPLDTEEETGDFMTAQRSNLGVAEPEPPKPAPSPQARAPALRQVHVIRGTQQSSVTVRN
ncbi:Flp pilus assembly protein CpaB [Litchfieldella qijiaojingensis]|uniref:Flp pilus assembly protein CpaB n=1 Tax=Litchfieldella qijiaojingensis TaxID=980347 RepID=A0ABQ2YHE4_9GAMM|nr:Flp pilus assembly protein CpaB [Halomonas qijiaojingensis]GGX82968.1 Flp pilus assembly protein CpaB [Halomonas qijiaojingensis]